MKRMMIVWTALAAGLLLAQQQPRPVEGGYLLPNGWRITPIGKAVETGDLIMSVVSAPDGRAVVAMHSGYNPHGLVVIDTATGDAVQRISLKSAWGGMAWSPDGKKLYVSGGNANARPPARPTRAPIYVFDYRNGRLSHQPVGTLEEKIDLTEIYWSGLTHHPSKHLLFAANRGTRPVPGTVVVFDTATGKLLKRIKVEMTPYDVEISPDGGTVYVSNWSSDSVSVIDTDPLGVVATIRVGDNPNDMELTADGRLFVACSNDNSVFVIDTKKGTVVEKISTTLYPQAPEGSTPNALALDAKAKLLFVANADNNSVAVISIADPAQSKVLGFLPAGWYPSALAVLPEREQLYIGNGKGLGSYSNVLGPLSPLRTGKEDAQSVKSLQQGSVNIVELSKLKTKLAGWTRRVYENCPYHDELLARARPPKTASIVPQTVGQGSPIRHVIYIIKENRTYDQVFGDIPKGNGDPRLTIFGRRVTPNQHALAEQFVLFDNLYCDAEVSVDGHEWSNAAYATDYIEKYWPARYGRQSQEQPVPALIPAAGFLWDQARRKGLTYRSYGERTTYSPETKTVVPRPFYTGLQGHVCPDFHKPGMRDTDNVAVFIREFDEYERNYDSADPEKRLPNFIVMSLPENHTRGTAPGAYTPQAMVANNDYAVGMLVDRVTHSKYWPETAIFIIEDDAQNGPDHVDARRTVGLVLSPYSRLGSVDSTLYTTSSMLRTIELLLGLQPMSQYDAAANPMYAAFATKKDLTPFDHLKPLIDVNAKNTPRSYGAQASLRMDFSDVDLIPMRELNEIIWKSIKGAGSVMPPPVRSFHFADFPQSR